MVWLPFSHAADYKNESELSTFISGGNTEQALWNTKTKNTLSLDKNTVTGSGHYTYGKTDQELSARNWDIKLRYDRAFFESYAVFVSAQLEEDRLANIEYRWNYDLGVAKNWIKTKKLLFKTELGVRRTLESDYAGSKRNASKGRLYGEYAHQMRENLKAKLWSEYLPNFSEGEDWQLSFEPSLHFTLSENLTFKVAYLHKYDNLPALGSKKSDYQQTISLIANF